NKLYTETVKKSLEKENITTSVCVLQNGETNKNIESIYNIYFALARNELSRKDIIIALGGGVIGDMAGYAAATWMRGIDFVQIPTTLLACVDSSVGGKTGINIKEGKNLVGAFHSPRLVIMDSDVLNTLPKREFNAGMAEVIKHAFLFDKKLLEYLENNNSFNMDFILKRNCELKGHIVEIDYKEKKERMFLNFGHTIGHSVENAAGYGVLLHGEAVAIGVIFAMEYGIKKDITKDKSLLDRAKNIFGKFSLPTEIPSNINLKDAIKLDKKRSNDEINFVFLEDIEKPLINKVSINDIVNLL
ncbi:3-dehydroquinate synthase, partial [Brachyspira pilosicoli]|uniref:3-dehydroquinate synthase n=1 Tax=Brachyspira pilosicoli TaxID=52584 RepID=UPI001CA54CFA